MGKYYIIIFVSVVFVITFLFISIEIYKGQLTFNNEVKISDFITFVSVMIAFTAFIISSKQNNENLSIVKKQQNDNVKNMESKQASEISCWIEGLSSIEQPNGASQNTIPYDATIQNNSSAPVYSSYIFSVSNKSKDDFDKINAQPDETVYIDVLKPGKNSIKIKTGGSAMGGERPSLAMVFKDVNSKYWYRSPHGNLKKISENQLYETLHKLKISIPIPPYDFSDNHNSL